MYFVFDVDGTVCFNGKSIEQDIQQAIDRLIAVGHEVVFASARPIRDLLPVLPKRFHKLRLIGGNGAFTSFNGSMTSVTYDEHTKQALFHCIERHDCKYLADSEWDFSYTGDCTHPIYRHLNVIDADNRRLEELPNLCKLVLFEVNDDLLQELAELPVLLTKYKSEDIYDISPLGINKIRGLQQFHIEQFVAFGNDQNDVCLFEQAAFSVCVGKQDAHAYADVIITQQEVAVMIEKLATEIVDVKETKYDTSK